MPDLSDLLLISAGDHDHLCPRQVLGVRIGLAGMAALGFEPPVTGKRLLAIVENDGCFADGVSAATGCTVGHRTLRVEDCGKVAATFVDVETGRAVRVAPVLDARARAVAWLPDAPSHYAAQLQAYQVMPVEELLTITEVELRVPVTHLVSRPGVRVNCDVCGEEIINEREVCVGGQTLCQTCAGHSYYEVPVRLSLARPQSPMFTGASSCDG